MKAFSGLRNVVRLLAAKSRGKRLLLQAHIRVIDSCNLRCSYCFGDYPVRNIPPPSTDQLLVLLSGLASMGAARVTLTGGEPTLRDDIVHVVHIARRLGLLVSLTSNGSLLPEKREILPELSQLTISLDGNKSVHDGNRGSGSYDRALEAIKIARAAGTEVQLLCTINHLTTIGLTDVFEIAHRFDCRVTFDLLAPYYAPDGNLIPRAEQADDQKIKRIIAGINQVDRKRLVLSDNVINYILAWPVSYAQYWLRYKDLPAGFKPIPCAAGRYFVMIETDGSMYPCCRVVQGYDPPNAYLDGIKSAWEKMKSHDCAACCSAGFNMFNSLMALEPRSVFHLLRQGN